jgi:hypothetical protein
MGTALSKIWGGFFADGYLSDSLIILRIADMLMADNWHPLAVSL